MPKQAKLHAGYDHQHLQNMIKLACGERIVEKLVVDQTASDKIYPTIPNKAVPQPLAYHRARLFISRFSYFCWCRRVSTQAVNSLGARLYVRKE